MKNFVLTEQNMQFLFSFRSVPIYKLLLFKMHGFLLICPQFTMKTSTIFHGQPHLIGILQILLRISSSILYLSPTFTIGLLTSQAISQKSSSLKYLSFVFHLCYILNTSSNTMAFIYWCWHFKSGRVLFPTFGQALLPPKGCLYLGNTLSFLCHYFFFLLIVQYIQLKKMMAIPHCMRIYLAAHNTLTVK